jgi:prevent-host-death family protein
VDAKKQFPINYQFQFINNSDWGHAAVANATRLQGVKRVCCARVTMTAEVGTGQLAELVKQVQAGNEILLTQGNQPVAKIVPASQKETASDLSLQIRSLKGHRIITPVISQAELAEEMFARK